jgi:hypothetical protein
MSQRVEIGYDDLDYVTKGEAVFLFKGQPFSGTTIDRYPDGRVECEVSFEDGREHGAARDWHPNGQIGGETPYLWGVIHGLVREWFDDGSLHVEARVEFGWLMRKEVRNEKAEVVEVYERPPTDPMYQYVLKRRAESPGGPARTDKQPEK